MLELEGLAINSEFYTPDEAPVATGFGLRTGDRTLRSNDTGSLLGFDQYMRKTLELFARTDLVRIRGLSHAMTTQWIAAFSGRPPLQRNESGFKLLDIHEAVVVRLGDEILKRAQPIIRDRERLRDGPDHRPNHLREPPDLQTRSVREVDLDPSTNLDERHKASCCAVAGDDPHTLCVHSFGLRIILVFLKHVKYFQ